MSKRKSSTGYSHVNTYNPRAHESEDRKVELSRSLEVKRHEKRVARLKDELSHYIHPDDVDNTTPDPAYILKGAARPAQDSYRPPGYRDPVEAINVFQKYKGCLFDHEAGREYLEALRDLGVSYINMGRKTRDAAAVFLQMLELDIKDRLVVKCHLLRCYMAGAWGDKARELMETSISGGNHSSCFVYNKALLECISLNLNESGTSEESRDESLKFATSANPFTVWILAYGEIFQSVFEQTELIDLLTLEDGSIEDAISYFEADYELWQETKGALTWLQQYLIHKDTKPPIIDRIIQQKESELSNIVDTLSIVREKNCIMFLRMFETGLEMMAEQRQKNSKKLRR